MDVVWKPVIGYEDLYAVSSEGDVKRTTMYRNSTDRPLKKSVVNGYHQVTLSKENKRASMLVHRVVAAAFIGLPDGLVVNHKDGNRTNNALSNLEVVTRSENERHKWGTLKTGALNNIKLTWDDVNDIRSLHMEGDLSLRELGQMFGVTKGNIHSIVTYKTWRIPGPSEITNEALQAIYKLSFMKDR